MNRAIRRGGALIAALVTLLVVALVAAAVVRQALASQRQARQQLHELQAQWLAEAALDRARAQLARQPEYAGETWKPSLPNPGGEERSAAVDIRIEQIESMEQVRRIVATAHFPDHEWQRATVRRENIVPLQNTESRSSPPGSAATVESRP